MATEAYREGNITCPYCGNVRKDWCDYPWGEKFENSEDKTEIQCDECERWFIVTLHVDYCFTSRPKEAKMAEPITREWMLEGGINIYEAVAYIDSRLELPSVRNGERAILQALRSLLLEPDRRDSIITCPSCGRPWNTTKNTACACGAILKFSTLDRQDAPGENAEDGKGEVECNEMDRFLSACSGSPEDRERYVSSVLQKQDAETARPSVGREALEEAIGQAINYPWQNVDMVVDRVIKNLTALGLEVKDAQE